MVHVRDLNFVLRSEIFVHIDWQFRASHLILSYVPVYKTWQPFSQDLLLDNPLQSYIDVRHANFLPPKLTPGEARDLGSRYITTEDLTPIKDESAKRVSRSHQEHVLLEKQVDLVPLVEQEAVEVDPDAEMVTRRKMTVSRFFPGSQPSAESQQPQSKGRALPPPSSNHAKKKQRLDNQSPKAPGDAPIKDSTPAVQQDHDL